MYGLSIELSDGSPPVLHLRGDLDLANADDFGAALDEALKADPATVLDLADLVFVDAAGLHVIMQAAKARNGAGPLRLVNASRVARLLEIVGLENAPTIDIHEGS
jgi:anti-sigma B factor antagonist